MPNISTLKVATGVAGTVTVAMRPRQYHGVVLKGGSDASAVTVYAGVAATAGNEIGFAACAANGSGHDNPPDDGISPDEIAAGLHVVVTGTAAYALVRYSR